MPSTARGSAPPNAATAAARLTRQARAPSARSPRSGTSTAARARRRAQTSKLGMAMEEARPPPPPTPPRPPPDPPSLPHAASRGTLSSRCASREPTLRRDRYGKGGWTWRARASLQCSSARRSSLSRPFPSHMSEPIPPTHHRMHFPKAGGLT